MEQASSAPDLQYPLGRFDWPQEVTPERRAECIRQIKELPSQLHLALGDLSDSQLDTPYRPEGWTVRELVHHIADSHLNSYIRFKLALTENEPTIKPYDQAAWAVTPDSRMPVDSSLSLLDGLHRRWAALLRSMTDADFARTFRHPELGLVRLDTNVALYAWHGRHHLAHITGLRARMGWK